MTAIRFRDLLFVCWYSKFAIGRFLQVSCGTSDLLVLSSPIISDYILVLIARNIRLSKKWPHFWYDWVVFRFWVFECHISDLSKTVWNDLKRADKVELLIICSCEVGIYFSCPCCCIFSNFWVVSECFLLPVRESGPTSG